MNYFLAKTEPGTYSIADLERDGTTVWDGVKNPLAVRAIKEMREGDRVFIYHSGAAPGIAGLALVTKAGAADPKDPSSAVAGFKFLLFFEQPTTLAEIKAAESFADWALVRQSRLSTMAVPGKFVAWMRKRYPGLEI